MPHTTTPQKPHDNINDKRSSNGSSELEDGLLPEGDPNIVSTSKLYCLQVLTHADNLVRSKRPNESPQLESFEEMGCYRVGLVLHLHLTSFVDYGVPGFVHYCRGIWHQV